MPSSRSTPSASPARRRAARWTGDQTSVRSGKRSPSASAFWPTSGDMPVRLRWSEMTISVPGPYAGLIPPAALVRIASRGAELAEQQHRLDDEARGVALVEVEASLDGDDRHAADRPEDQAADVARRRRDGPAGQVLEGDRGRVLDLVGEAAQARAHDHADGRDEVAPLADGRRERGEAGGLVGRGDRAGAVESGIDVEDMAAAPAAAGPAGGAGDVRAVKLRRPAGVPTPGCRSRPSGRPTGPCPCGPALRW